MFRPGGALDGSGPDVRRVEVAPPDAFFSIVKITNKRLTPELRRCRAVYAIDRLKVIKPSSPNAESWQSP